MSENQQPLTEEEQAVPSAKPMEPDLPESVEAGEATLPAETDADLSAEDEAEDAETEDEELEAEEEDIDPADVKIFGMPRVCFHYTAFGVAIGYLVSGIIGIAGFNPPSATICAIVCAAIGYFIGNRLYKKRKAARDAAAQSPESAE